MRPISWKRRLMVRWKNAYQSQSLLTHLPIEKLKMEYEANTILLKHEITSKTEALDKLTKEHQKQAETCKELQHQLQEISASVSQLLYTPPDPLFMCFLFSTACSAPGRLQGVAGAAQHIGCRLQWWVAQDSQATWTTIGAAAAAHAAYHVGLFNNQKG